MLPASLYTPLYHHVMLLVVIGCALLYWFRPGLPGEIRHFNVAATVLVCIGVVLFIGLRPISGVFVDMVGYARSYESVQQGGATSSNDALFNCLMQLCSPFLPAEGFFLVCSLIYVAPLALASWRVHGAWAFPVFLACLTAFSFWGYGVNGIRNGMATSVLILAFAFYDKPVVMIPLMAAALGFHGSILLPAVAFIIVRYIKRTEFWMVVWVVCVLTSLVVGNVGAMLVSHFNPFTEDNRLEGYVINSWANYSGEAQGFRPGFLAYSIFPVVVTLLLSAPSRSRSRHLVGRVMLGTAMSWIGNRSAMTAKRLGMGRRKLAGLHGPSPVGGLVLAGVGPIFGSPRSAVGSKPSTLNSQPSTREQPSAFGRQTAPERHDKTMQSAWGQLPWVRMLRSDPFYARLVNTYLFANAVWVLFIHVRFSNRFAYLSWFMMPWVLLYPFVPGKANVQPRVGLIAAILTIHYLFTYFMWVVVYRMRFG